MPSEESLGNVGEPRRSWGSAGSGRRGRKPPSLAGPRVCKLNVDRQGGKPRPTGPTAGQATPGRALVGGNDRSDLERTNCLNETSTDCGAGTSVSSDVVPDAGASDRRGPAAGCLSPDASRWRARGGRGDGGGVRGQPRGEPGRLARAAAQRGV
jgi:hypothetical protein